MLGNQPPGFMILPTEAGTSARILETTDAYLDRPGRRGPQVDHLEQLLRRQRRRRAVRRGLLSIGTWVPRRQRPATGSTSEVPTPVSTPAPVLPRPRPALDEVFLDEVTIDLDRSTAGGARGASSALGALPRQAGHGEHREHDDRGAVLPPRR
jgi:hypothetical protein